MTPHLSIIVLSWNSKQITQDCIDSIIANVQCDYELILIDNGSHDGSAEMIRERYPNTKYPRIKTIFNDINLGFAGGNNQGYEHSTGEYILLLNSDTIVPAGSIEAMSDWLDQHNDYGAATVKLLNSDGSTQYYMHRQFPTAWSLLLALLHKRWRGFQPGPAKRYLYLDTKFEHDFDIDQAAGACLMVRRSVVEELGVLLDVKHFSLYYNDVDFCYRIKQAGYKIRCLTNVTITHLKGTSVRKLDFLKNSKEYTYSSLWFFKQHKQWLSYFTLKLLYTILFSVLTLAAIIQPKNLAKRWGILKQVLWCKMIYPH